MSEQVFCSVPTIFEALLLHTDDSNTTIEILIVHAVEEMLR